MDRKSKEFTGKVACVASVSIRFWSRERPVLAVREIKREPNNERGGRGRGRKNEEEEWIATRENCFVTQSRLLIKQWSFGFIESSPLARSKVHEKLFWFHTRVLFSASRRSIVLLVNHDSCWQHQMSVRALWHDRPSGRFSKSRGLSASASFLSSPPPLRSFTCAIFCVVFDSRSSFFAPKPRGNACYAGYWKRH